MVLENLILLMINCDLFKYELFDVLTIPDDWLV